MIEFKQIIGRGTRLFDDKYYFTIYDFVQAYDKFADPEWDGDPIPEVCKTCQKYPCECEPEFDGEPEDDDSKVNKCKDCGNDPCTCKKEECPKCHQTPCICTKKNMIEIKLKNGNVLEFNHTVKVSFWSKIGKPLSVKEFIESLYGELPELFKDENKLRKIWSMPKTRQAFLKELEQAGFSLELLNNLRRIIDAEKSDLFDVLEYLFNSEHIPIARSQRVQIARSPIFAFLNDQQKEFISFVLQKYISHGISELDIGNLIYLLKSKYGTTKDATRELGPLKEIKSIYTNFQKHLYQEQIKEI